MKKILLSLVIILLSSCFLKAADLGEAVGLISVLQDITKIKGASIWSSSKIGNQSWGMTRTAFSFNYGLIALKDFGDTIYPVTDGFDIDSLTMKKIYHIKLIKKANTPTWGISYNWGYYSSTISNFSNKYFTNSDITFGSFFGTATIGFVINSDCMFLSKGHFGITFSYPSITKATLNTNDSLKSETTSNSTISPEIFGSLNLIDLKNITLFCDFGYHLLIFHSVRYTPIHGSDTQLKEYESKAIDFPESYNFSNWYLKFGLNIKLP